MVRPRVVLNSIKTALQESGRLPDTVSYATFELDSEGGQSNVRPPVVEITPIDIIRNNDHHTDFHRYATDDDDNEIGYIYRVQYNMVVQIDVWTAEGDPYDPNVIGEEIRRVLAQYDAYQMGSVSNSYLPVDTELPDPDDPSSSLDGIGKFFLGDGSVANDLTMTPALRRWRQEAEVWFYEELNTVEEYGEVPSIEAVDSPDSDDNVDD